MDKGIECGVRITKRFMELDDDAFGDAVPSCVARFKSMLFVQRRRYNAIQAVATSKAAVDSWSTKGVEVYCRMKSMNESEVSSDEKNFVRALGLLATRVECGVRVKEFIFELPEVTFKSYVNAAAESFEASIREQRAAYQELKAQKSLDLTGALKDVELYCEWKSMCG